MDGPPSSVRPRRQSSEDARCCSPADFRLRVTYEQEKLEKLMRPLPLGEPGTAQGERRPAGHAGPHAHPLHAGPCEPSPAGAPLLWALHPLLPLPGTPQPLHPTHPGPLLGGTVTRAVRSCGSVSPGAAAETVRNRVHRPWRQRDSAPPRAERSPVRGPGHQKPSAHRPGQPASRTRTVRRGAWISFCGCCSGVRGVREVGGQVDGDQGAPASVQVRRGLSRWEGAEGMSKE